MKIEDMNMVEVEARAAEIATETAEASEERMTELKAELEALIARKNELTEIEERAKTAAALNACEVVGKVVEKTEIPKEGRNMINRNSAEYRDAFYAWVAGRETAEQRSVLANPISVDGNGTADGMAVALPTTLDEKIWDNVHTAHPVLADVQTVASGVILKVTKHTAITAGKAAKKNDGAALAAEEENTFVEVNLVGKDFSKCVRLTYAEAKMSQGALEDYLANEIAADIGEALAADIFAQMVTDAGSRSTSKSTNGWFSTIATALGTVTGAVKPVIYCTAANYYAIFGEVDAAGQPVFRNGVAIGAEVKIDSAVPASVKAVVVDPAKFVLNMVQDVMIETDRDIKEHQVLVSGYCRAQGCMRDNTAAGKIVA